MQYAERIKSRVLFELRVVIIINEGKVCET